MNTKKTNTVRLTIDFPIEQHTHLKIRASHEGVSMREYILEALAEKEEHCPQSMDLDSESFRKGLMKIKKERKQLAQNLSKR